MTIVAGDILRTSINFSLADGTQYQNVFHHKRTGVGILTHAQHITAITSWAQDMYNEIITIVSDDVVEQLSYVDRVDFVVDQWEVVENIGTFTPTFNPSNVQEALANQMSAFVVFKTTRPKTVGRKFLFPMTEQHQDAGILSSTAVDALVLWANDAVNNITIQVLDYLVPGVPRVGVNAFYEFYVAIVTNLMGSQRRRRPGTGS